MHSSYVNAQVPSGHDTLFSPQVWYKGHSFILALQELSKHFIGRSGGHTDIVEQAFSFPLQEPSGHLKGKVEGQESKEVERHSLILLTQAPFQHLIWFLPQYIWVGHNSIEFTHVPS